jgi:preprotein translocase subunit YajC
MDRSSLLALAGPAQGGNENPMGGFVMMGIIFAIFYFILIRPMRTKQKKLEDLVKALKPGDKVIINPGIYGTVEGIDQDTLLLRIAEKTRIRVLRSAVAGLQEAPEKEGRK